MERRRFLKTGLVTAAACAGLGPTRARSEAPGASLAAAQSGIPGRLSGTSLKLSLAAYSFRKELSGERPEMTLEEFIDFCAREDLDATELTEYYFRRKDPEYVCSLKRRAHVNGLAISGAPVGNDFCLPPGEKRSAELARVKSWIDVAGLLGAQTIRVFAGRAARGTSDQQARDWAVQGLREASEYAGTKGVILALENHGGITATVDELLALVRAVDSPWLGVNLDTGNFHERVYESLETAAPHAVSVQVKVEVAEKGRPAEEADFGRIAGILRRAGYRGYVALEYEAKEDARAAVPRYLAKLREAIG